MYGNLEGFLVPVTCNMFGVPLGFRFKLLQRVPGLPKRIHLWSFCFVNGLGLLTVPIGEAFVFEVFVPGSACIFACRAVPNCMHEHLGGEICWIR